MRSLTFRHKLTGIFLATGIAGALCAAIFLWRTHDVPPATVSVQESTQELFASDIAQSSLFKFDGLPPSIDLQGEIEIAGALHPLAPTGVVAGQRAFGASGVSAADVQHHPYRLTLRLSDRETRRVIDLSLSVDAQTGMSAQIRGLDAEAKAALSLNGREVYPQTQADWNGRIAFAQTQPDLTLIQLSLIPDAYSSYTLFAGALLPYYLQDFTAPPNVHGGLPEFPLSRSTTTPAANEQAQKLEGGTQDVLGWWLTESQSAIMTRRIGPDCSGACLTRLYLKQQDGNWQEIFSNPLGVIWLDGKTIGQDGSFLYSGTAYGTQRWNWQDGRYLPVEETEGGE